MGLINVSAATLRTKAEELANLNSTLKTNINELETSEQNLTTMWEGQTKDAFHNAFHSDKVQMDNFSRLIDNYVAALENVATKYEQAENTNLNTASTRSYK